MSRIHKAIERARQTHRPENEVDKELALSDIAARRKYAVEPAARTQRGERLADLDLVQLKPSMDILQQNRIVSSLLESKHNAVDAYKMLRTKTLRTLAANKWNILAITSTAKGEGKTLTAINLALSISQDPNFDAVVIDADLRSPTVHERFGLQPSPGLADYLEGKVGLSEIFYSPGIDSLGIIPNTRPVVNSAEALSSHRMRELMESMRALSSSVIVIVDMPPLVVDDALAIAPLMDAFMLVFKAGVTRRDDVRAAREISEDLSVIGCVVNGAQGSSPDSYY